MMMRRDDDGSVEAEARNVRDLERLMFFSDGVFAIAITLLALDLDLPQAHGAMTSPELVSALLDELPEFRTFLIGFEVIGVFWLAHHRLFSLVERFSRPLALLNLLFLLTIVFLPFATRVLGEYGTLTSAAALYGLSLVATSLTLNIAWMYAARGRLLAPDVSAADVRAFTTRGMVTLALFALSIPIAFISPILAQVSWIVVAAVVPLAERLARRFAASRHA